MMSSGVVAVLVGRTGIMVKVLVPEAVQAVPAALPLHGCFGSVIETVTCPGLAKSWALRRRRAPEEQGVVVEQVVAGVVVVEVDAAATGKIILVWPKLEGLGNDPPPG